MSVKYDSILGALRTDDSADISSLEEAITTEQTARTNADTALQAAIEELKPLIYAGL